MTTTSCRLCTDLPKAPPDGPAPTATDTAVQPFDSVLASVSGEKNAEVAPPIAEPASPESTKDPVNETPEEVTDEPEAPQIPYAYLLTSCYPGWPIVPPGSSIEPTPPAPIDTGVQGEVLTADSSVQETPTPTAANATSGSAPTAPQSTISEPSRSPLPPPSLEQPTLPSSKEKTTTPEAQPDAAARTELPTPTASEAPVKILPTGNIRRFQSQLDSLTEVESPRAALDGIPVAKEHRAMSDVTFHQPAKIAPAPFADGETPSKTTASLGPETDGRVLAPAPLGHDETQGGMADERHEHSPAEPFPQIAEPGLRREDKSAPFEAPSVATDTARVIQNIERAIERMRTHGEQHMEMRLPMRDGQEVVVKLRLEQGEVKATFQSTSDTLQQALETGWSQVTHASNERAGKIASTVVETSSLESGTGSFQQSPDHRDRSGNTRYSETLFAPLPGQPETRKAAPPRRPAPGLSPSTSLEIYA